MADFKKLRTVQQIAAQSNGAFTAASLRWSIFRAEQNGLDAAIIRLGRRVLIDEDGFNAWLETKRAKA